MWNNMRLLLAPWCSGCLYAQLFQKNSELRFCAGSNLASLVLRICSNEDIWEWSRLEIRLNVFRRSTIPQKQFIIIIYHQDPNYICLICQLDKQKHLWLDFSKKCTTVVKRSVFGNFKTHKRILSKHFFV